MQKGEMRIEYISLRGQLLDFSEKEKKWSLTA